MSGRRCAVPQLHILDVCLTCDPMCAPCRVGAGGDSRVRRAERALRIGRCPAGTGGGPGCPAGPRRTQTAARGRGPEPGPGREGAGCATRDGDRLGGGTHRATPSRAGRLHPSSRRPRCPLPRPRVALRLGARTSYRPIRQLAAACAHIARPARGKPGGPGPGGERAPAGGQEDSGRACRGRALRPRAARRRGRRRRRPYCAGGLVLDCPLADRPGTWSTGRCARRSSALPACTGTGKDADPLIVLTASAAAAARACRRVLEDRRGLRLPEDHTVVKQIAKAKWRLTKRGLRPVGADLPPGAGSARRQCVQLAHPALGRAGHPGLGQCRPAAAGRARPRAGQYATRVITPRGSTAVAGLELMTALRPPTRAVQDEATGELGVRPTPGSLDGAGGSGAARGPRRASRRRRAVPARPPAHPGRDAGRGGVRLGARPTATDEECTQAVRGRHRREHRVRRGRQPA